MSISINYCKQKNVSLFAKMKSYPSISLENVQNYTPIYDRFFSLNENNWNSINLNYKLRLTNISDAKNKNVDNPIFLGKTVDDNDKSSMKKIFIKQAPLLDPFKYVVGKYDTNDAQLFNLPSFVSSSNKIHPKIADPNNSSFVDGFFTYLSSQTLHVHNFTNALDCHGTYLGIKNNFKLDVIDDLEYLVKSDFFIKNKGKLFTIDDYSHLMLYNDEKPLKPLKITDSIKSLKANEFDNSIFEDIFANTVSLNDIKELGIDLIDITDSNIFAIDETTKTQTASHSESDSDCSSRSSHTNDDDLNQNDFNDEHETVFGSKNSGSECEDGELNECKSSECEDDDDEDIESYDDDNEIMLTLPKFPVQIICMECCEETLDDLIMNNDLTEQEWFSALFQVIMILLTFQKMFAFTHNDLHGNNIMYVKTNEKYLYYRYKKKTYKVPTFGRVFKIIDFGRSIYKFNGKVFCSDSFQNGGDAYSQYNTEPFFNNNKPRLDPNFSFDICRLACSLFDYVVDDFDAIKKLNECSELIKLVVDWCLDDNGNNVLYKNNGVERYPDFKLYKMISRCVHRHTPQAQLDRTIFSNYIISNKNLPKNEHLMNIDDIPCYI